jgi:hypothetical protein
VCGSIYHVEEVHNAMDMGVDIPWVMASKYHR